MQKILFADLDDTLFHSYRKHHPGPGWLVAATLRDGSAFSYTSPRQRAAFELWQSVLTIIPVTARNHDSFRRVTLAFHAEAILDYGAVVLDSDGAPDPDWLARSASLAREHDATLQSWFDKLCQHCEEQEAGLRVRWIDDFGVRLYLVAKSTVGNVDAVSALAQTCRAARDAGQLPADVTIHCNANNLAILPRWLDKRHAVEYVQRRYTLDGEPPLSFGMGDSLVDLPFLAACDYQIVPTHSQIGQAIDRIER
ncbi:hypothetical protein [Candidatus Symbiobacter mobilis]|uniref:hypothetical protein n=1 Tax=Candidatus Symbiobacter mobilis TaxID=1436290 RepID=UPI00059EAB27|nr:hypothetical protein [Candidatus Symbiobacter mobilis]